MRAVACSVVAALCAGASGQIVDTFENNTNQGGWAFGGPMEFIAPTGGNPGGYLRSVDVDTTIPWLRCVEGSPFTGNYREMRVATVVVDVNVFETDFNIGPFPLTIILVSENGSPSNSEDDWAVFKLGDPIPTPGTGWRTRSFQIPFKSQTMPAGWGFIQFGPASPPSPDWNMVITDVARLEFSFGDPELFYIFQQWTVGADNIALGQVAPPLCYANCDGSTGSPLLTANDFQCFINKYAANDAYANCDGSTGIPALTANDFQCFINRYAAGCS